MSDTPKPITRVAMLRKHGVNVPLAAAISLANMFPGPIKEDSLERRYVLALNRRGYIAPNSNPESFGDLRDYELTPQGVAAVKRIAAADEEFKAQPKPKRGRPTKPVPAA